MYENLRVACAVFATVYTLLVFLLWWIGVVSAQQLVVAHLVIVVWALLVSTMLRNA